ncbi:MAG: putative quorum-quenching lactonase YtnP [Pseudomonadota bacterium]
MLNRRHFLGAAIGGASAFTLFPVWSQNPASFGAPTLPSPGFRKTRIGEMDVITVNDGILRRPLGAEFVPGIAIEQVRGLLASQGLSTDYVDVPYTPCVVVKDGQRYLFDAGFADNGPPSAGRLVANLAAAGLSPDDIHHVVISHFHGDHISGLRRKDGSLVFPRAKVHVPAPEHAFWTDEARIAAAPPAMRGAFDNVKRVFGTMPADQLVKFEPGREIAPGIESVAAFGHSPGHTVFVMRSQGQSFAFVADITNVPSLFARRPDWSVVFDMNPEMARQSRRRIFDMLVKEKMPAAGFHFPFPAIGTIETIDGGYQFKAMG